MWRRAQKPSHTQLAPATLQVMMAPTCPNCPRVVAACGRVAAAHAQVQLEVVDVQYFADLAGAVKSVPTVIVDATRSLVGNLSAAYSCIGRQAPAPPGAPGPSGYTTARAVFAPL